VACHCGSKKAFTSLGVALHTEQNQACAHASWAFTTYKAVGKNFLYCQNFAVAAHHVK